MIPHNYVEEVGNKKDNFHLYDSLVSALDGFMQCFMSAVCNFLSASLYQSNN